MFKVVILPANEPEIVVTLVLTDIRFVDRDEETADSCESVA